ncbi:MAG TPA: hypothetical protein VKU86_11400, partial [Acidimicrobiales bacterium]|nr:hypothetical protein [Acidimicrobiales bacterium]
DATGAVAGYALVCTDVAARARWARRRRVAFAVGALLLLAARRGSALERRFLRLRLRDGWVLWRAGATPPLPVDAHFNTVAGHRGGSGGRLLAAHIDACTQRAGFPGWYGEINAIAGRRAASLERSGGRVVGRTPNRTLSALVGRPVERLTVVRMLPGRSASGASVDAA